MNTFLLTWNPKKSPADGPWLMQGGTALRAGKPFVGRWRTGNNKGIQVGDRVFLQRQGNRRPGLIGAGTVIRGSELEDRGDGKQSLYCHVDWAQMLPAQELPKSELLNGILPATLLKTASSGSQAPIELCAKLETRWAAHLSSLHQSQSGGDSLPIVISALTFNCQFARFNAQVQHKSGGQSFTSFRDGLPAKWEDYKEGVRNEALRLLAVRAWKRNEIGSGKILSRVILAIEINDSSRGLRNNLVQWPNRYGPKQRSHRALLEARDRAPARQTIEALLFGFFTGQIEESVAFGQFCDLLGTRYDLLAYLFFLKDWSRFMPIAPTTFDQAFKQLGVDLVTSHQCSWNNYVQFNAALAQVQTLLREVAEVGDARLIDAHSFCWMLVRLKLPATAQSPTIPLPRNIGNILPMPRRPAAAAAQSGEFVVVTEEDFSERDARRRRLGNLAQDVALQSERRRLRELGLANPAASARPVWDEPARGYDILSTEPNGTPRHIEVKSARKSGERLSFFLSRNEWEQSRTKPNYWFYLVLETESAHPDVIAVPAADLALECLAPVNYLAILQTGAH